MNKKKKFHKKTRHFSKNQLETQVLKLLQRISPKALNIHQISSKLKSSNKKGDVKLALDAMIERQKIKRRKDGRYIIAHKNQLSGTKKIVRGTVDSIQSGAAYIVIEDLDNDIYVPAKYLNDALDGDAVKVAIISKPGRRRQEGRVVEIIERGRSSYLGSLRLFKNRAIAFIAHGPITFEVVIPHDATKDAKDFDKVLVEITDWNSKTKNAPIGKVIDVLGPAGSNNVEMQAILLDYGFDLHFSTKALAELDTLSEELQPDEMSKRRDMRAVTTFTIDPEDAKDFDDALSIDYKEDGMYEIGVHIADVSHYVQPGTQLDKEALARGNSVYLVDRVLPMLPEKLSNGWCSLRPNEEKRCFSAVFTMDDTGKIHDQWIGKTMILSDKRFAYEEAQEVMDSGEGPFLKELNTLNEIARKLRKERYKHGSINFETEEVRFKLDEKGFPISLYVKERKEVHLLIEDFMLLANKTVAAFIGKRKNTPEIPFVYRVHDLPDMDRVEDFSLFAKAVGFEMHTDTPGQIAKAFNRLTQEAKKNDALKILQPLAIRTMAKAIYTTDNIGHFGLGFEYYSHFTSPIRRYADLMVHRLLEKNLESEFRANKETLELTCRHISGQERKAMEAERASIKYKQVEFITQYIGQSFEGRISGMIERGLFIEITQFLIEGMVAFDSLDEPFSLDDARLMAIGKYSRHTYKMGDVVKVLIAGTDLAKRQVEMEIVQED